MLKEKALQVVNELADKIIYTVAPCRLVVGLSGGADSTLALIVGKTVTVKDPRYTLLAVHCIHGLDADDPIWLAHCQKLCKKVDAQLVTPKLHIVYGNGRSPEEVSRTERYNALFSNAKDNGVLVLGHQADDQVENFLLALKRGSGPYGLSGMSFYIEDNRGRILRPLLEYSKQEIISIIEALGYDHVFDISNTYLKFERNFMRLKVLPLLRERFSGIDGSILRSAKLCSYEHDLAMRYAKENYDLAFDRDKCRLDISKFDVNDTALVTCIIRLFLNEKTLMPPEFNLVQETIRLCQSSTDQNGDILLGDYSVKRFKNYLYLVTKISLPEKKCYFLKKGEKLRLGSFEYALSDDFVKDEVILDFNYKGSLKLKPTTRAHSREIKKLFGEYEVPVWLRGTHCLVKDRDTGAVIAFGSLFITADYPIKANSSPLKIIQRQE